ncbi:MAG: hypothetical protein MUF83_17315 [Acidimicrobiales bacterium]|jgi:hypothetical protein|nr:hypothetical protein [Acidimicrobiales bacterium]
MGRQDVAEALRRLDDDTVRDHAADGDLADLSDLELDEDERMLVADAARDYPEVVGFAFGAFATQYSLLPAVQQSSWKWEPFGDKQKAYLTAYNYAMGDGSV